MSSFNGTTMIHTLDVSHSSTNSTRTLWDIIWSSAATLFACTWTAIHPNIPGMNEGKIAITSRRLIIMVMALVVPELMITWAARQFFSARQTAKSFNDTFGARPVQARGDHQNAGEENTATLLTEMNNPGLSLESAAGPKFTEWTLTHGFFAWMGGFILCVDGQPRVTLTPDELLHFARDGFVNIPDIARADIEDRSKGDMLSKGIAILQLIWFVIQLAARYIQNLPITLLEVDTLAVAVMTCITYGWWWKKPKDVGRPYLVHWKATAPSPGDLDYEIADAMFTANGLCSYSYYLFYPFLSLMGLEPIISPAAVRARRVPSLGGYAETRDGTILLIGCMSGTLFGAIHCLGWNDSVWLILSLAVLFAPVSILLSYTYESLDSHLECLPSIIKIFFRIIMAVSCAMYIIARMGLIAYMLVSLQSLWLFPGVYDTVAWTKFIPHY